MTVGVSKGEIFTTEMLNAFCKASQLTGDPQIIGFASALGHSTPETIEGIINGYSSDEIKRFINKTMLGQSSCCERLTTAVKNAAYTVFVAGVGAALYANWDTIQPMVSPVVSASLEMGKSLIGRAYEICASSELVNNQVLPVINSCWEIGKNFTISAFQSFYQK